MNVELYGIGRINDGQGEEFLIIRDGLGVARCADQLDNEKRLVEMVARANAGLLLESIPPTEQITLRRTSTGEFIAWTNRDALYRNEPTAVAAIADAVRDFTEQRPEPVRAWSYPTTLTEELGDALGLMCFTTGPIAHYLRSIGHKIRNKIEAEQAYVLHLLILIVLEHGANWRRVAAEQLLPPPTPETKP